MGKISFKTYSIETATSDGTILKGMIRYWAKDYYVQLLEPVEGEKQGEHLMHMIPAKFTVEKNKNDGTRKEEDVILVNIYHGAIKMLEEIYVDHCSTQS